MDIFDEIGKQLGETVGKNGVKLRLDEEQLLRLEVQMREMRSEVKKQWRITQVLMGIAIFGGILEWVLL